METINSMRNIAISATTQRPKTVKSPIVLSLTEVVSPKNLDDPVFSPNESVPRCSKSQLINSCMHDIQLLISIFAIISRAYGLLVKKVAKCMSL